MHPSIIRIGTSNIRTGKDGYTWGRPAKDSHILRLLDIKPEDIDIAEDEPVGELWLASDDKTYPSLVHLDGGSTITLTELLVKDGRSILGEKHFSLYGPHIATIMKLIDAGQPLSVQVHPAMGHPSRPAKPEMWMIVRSGARFYIGFNRDISIEMLKKAYEDGTLEGLLYQLEAGPEELFIVSGGLIHALRAETTLWEWSHALTGKELERGDLKGATVALWDRTDGKEPRPDKEDLEGTIEVLDDAAERARIPVYNKVVLDKIRSQRNTIYSDLRKNKIDRLFTTDEVIVDEIILDNTLPQDTDDHGYPIFILEGTVEIQAPDGAMLDKLTTNDCAIIPAYLGKHTLVNRSTEPSKIIRWYAPIDKMFC